MGTTCLQPRVYGVLLAGLALLGLLGCAAGGHRGAPPGAVSPTAAAADGGPVITAVLGSDLSLMQKGMNDQFLRERLAELRAKGFSLSWEASPDGWIKGLLEDQPQIDFYRRKAEIGRENGIGNAFALVWDCILPLENRPEFSEGLLGVTLDPATGRFATQKVWDYGSEDALRLFTQRARQLFEKMGPMEMFVIDEMLLASPGAAGGWGIEKISAYWTSQTYSEASLASFRKFLLGRSYPQAEQARFPVTTTAVPASAAAGDGLPVITLDDANRGRLVADNEWPKSALWTAWYEWRQELFARWVGAVTGAAYEVWGGSPRWLGCMVSYPVHWYRTELATDLDALGALPQVDYLVGGYYTGAHYATALAAAIRSAAVRHGKKWGGMVELNYYGQKAGNDPARILEAFKYQVNAGAALMLVYPGTAFRQDRPEPQDNGLSYLPEQVAAWAACREWLEQGRTCKRVFPAP